MKKFFSLGISLMLFSFITSSLYAATPLVDAVWVKDQIGKEGVVMLDLRTPASYKKGHVPGAVYTNYSKDGWRVKNSEGIAGMLPPVDQISNLIGSLGIGNQDHVVLIPYGTSSSKLGTATRIYWTFKVLGHDKVSHLDFQSRQQQHLLTKPTTQQARWFQLPAQKMPCMKHIQHCKLSSKHHRCMGQLQTG